MRFGITLTLAAACVLLAGILPTCLYLYVEPRGRPLWAKVGDSPSTRRAPVLVRATAWLGFFLGQLAIPGLLAPVACGALLYWQAKLGFYKPMGFALTAVVGVIALVQSVLAMRLIPLGVRLLMRDPTACTSDRARRHALGSGSIVAAAAALSWAVGTLPRVVPPWLGKALDWTVLSPLVAYAAACLLHAGMLRVACTAIRPDAKT
jgi:hypothetical protein